MNLRRLPLFFRSASPVAAAGATAPQRSQWVVFDANSVLHAGQMIVSLDAGSMTMNFKPDDKTRFQILSDIKSGK